MNIYNCWYQGISGFTCKLGTKHWMFVPNLGQINNHIFRNLSLFDLVFQNSIEYQYELEKELENNRSVLVRFITSLIFPTM